MQKIILGVLIALCVIGIGAFLVTQNKTATPAAQTETASTETQTQTVTQPLAATSSTSVTPATPAAAQTGYTLADVAKHKDATSCYAAINGKVYDLTKWISQHPGGAQRILSICGKDGSSAFNGQHAGEARPASELAGFYLADLAQ